MRASLRCAACVIVAAFAALLSLASPAIAGETGLDHPPGEPALWPASDLLDSLQRAHATVPSERALDAWQRYALAWRDASDAIGPERARVQRAGQRKPLRARARERAGAAHTRRG
jgi:hypothetical protein